MVRNDEQPANGRFPFDIEWPYTVHELKTIDPYFDEVRMGWKRFELRRDDRNYQPGDLLVLRHWVTDHYTGAHTIKVAKYVMREASGFGLMPGFVAMSLDDPPYSLALSLRSEVDSVAG